VRSVTHALTIWQPWANAIVWCGKDIENRGWAPWPDIIGKTIAIHAGKVFDEDGALSIGFGWSAGRLKFTESQLLRLSTDLCPKGAIVGVARVTGFVRTSTSPWFNGPIGWKLADAFPLDAPVFCRGAQGLWVLPPDVRQALATRERHQDAPSDKAIEHVEDES